MQYYIEKMITSKIIDLYSNYIDDLNVLIFVSFNQSPQIPNPLLSKIKPLIWRIVFIVHGSWFLPHKTGVF